ncbi:MAG TPA: hypothetical protein VF921_13865, partial [Vicinamibacterales bacterium]
MKPLFSRPSFFPRRGARACGVLALGVALAGPSTHAMPRGQAAAAAPLSCNDLLLPPREVKGHTVGPSSCLMTESRVTYEGRAFVRLDIGLDGTVDGYLAKVGDYKDYFTNGPDLVFPQTWGPRPIFFGVARYERAKGAAMTILYPADKAAWNGRIFVMVHGRGVSM